MNDTSHYLNKKRIEVAIHRSESGIVLSDGKNQIRVKTSHPEKIIFPDRADFAVWFFLPIAMRTNQSLHVKGTGTQKTIENAETMSHIWQSWLPGHFYATNVSFDQLTQNQNDSGPQRDLCFYSGGIDSTYTILKRVLECKSQHLLTVHGMDYKIQDYDKFNEFIKKTSPFANFASDTRILVETDAYTLYKKYRINTDNHHVSHIFALAGSGFLHAEEYQKIFIAADYRIDQQFLVYPWGSNSATNSLFNDSFTELITDSDDITRSQKMPLLQESREALQSLSFCVDYSARPLNCGVCSKCMRTKLMFLASTGTIPRIFLSNDIPKDWMRSFKYEKPSEMAFLMDTIASAKLNKYKDSFPCFEKNENRVLAYRVLKNSAKKLTPRQIIKNLLVLLRNIA